MAFSLTDSLKSIFGGSPSNTKAVNPTVPILPTPSYSSFLAPNSTVPSLINSSVKPTAPMSIPSFATPSPTSSPVMAGPTFSAPTLPQVKSPVANAPMTAPAPIQSTSAPTTPTGLTLNQALTTQNGNQQNPPQNAPQTPDKPVVPSIDPNLTKAVENAQQLYQDSMKISPEELSTQEDLDKLLESTKAGYRSASGQAIPMEFITGQLKSIEQRATSLAEPLQTKLSRMQAARTSSLESSKFALDRADKALALAKDANKPISGTSFYDPATGEFKQAPSVTNTGSTSGFTLSAGEKRYDANGKLIASGGDKPLSQAQETANIAKTEKETASQQSATQSIGIINGLLAGDRYQSISGATQTGSIPFVGDRSAVNEYDQLQGLLKLGIRGLIKGQGAVSDYEGKILGQAASSLSRLTSESEMKQSLLKVRGVLKTNSGGQTDVIVKDKNGKVLGQAPLTGEEIYQAVKDGNVIQYL